MTRCGPLRWSVWWAVPLLLAFLSSTGWTDGTAATGSVSEASAELWFRVGEDLTYRLYWGVIPVGTSRARTDWEDYEGRRVIAIRFRTRSNGFLSKIYPVNDFIESLIDPESFLPIRFTKRLNEGHYHCDEITYFDHKKGTAKWYSKLKDHTKEYAIEKDTRDLASFMYYIRGQSRHFTPGHEEKFRVMADEKIYELYVKPLATEAVELPTYGDVPSVRFEPEATFEGLFVRKGKMWIWVSDDERRILTRVSAKVPVASVKVVLSDVSGPGDDFWIREGKGGQDDD